MEEYNTYNSYRASGFHELDEKIKKLDKFQVKTAKSLVCDYIQLEKVFKIRNPFRHVRHYVQGIMVNDSGVSRVDPVILRLVSNLYNNLSGDNEC